MTTESSEPQRFAETGTPREPVQTCPRCRAEFRGLGRHCRDCVIALHHEAKARGPVVIL